jgi:pimeloyl-ACP methyl ester carboxylesterase
MQRGEEGVAVMRDGRRLEFLVEGDPGGLPLVSHHGAPGAGVSWPPVSQACRDRGLALVLYTRAGYGASSRHPGRSVADVASDIEDLLDHLRQDRFVTLGWSAGGPHALACAAALGDRCLAAATVGGVAPWDNDGGLDFLEGIRPEAQVEIGAALKGLDVLVPYLEQETAGLRATTPEDLGEALGSLVSDVDKAFATGEHAAYLHATFMRATDNGIWGLADDDLSITRAWGFDLKDVTQTPVSVWQGLEDHFLPPAHGIYLADHLPNAHLHLLDNEGHLSPTGRIGDILDDLLDLAGQAPALL